MTRSVLFICTGNVCRSPMAAALFAAETAKRGDGARYSAASAGTWAPEGETAASNARAAMHQFGLSIEGHHARTVDGDMLQAADLVLVMTRHHLDALSAEFPTARPKMHLVSELVGQQYDVADPYGASLEDYQVCATELSRLIESGYRRVEEWLERSSVRREVPKD